MHYRPLLTLVGLLFTSHAFAQSVPAPVPVGKGSYASSPPPELLNDPNTGNNLRKRLAKQYDIVDQGGRPVPTNKWFTSVIENPLAGQLWPYPLRVQTAPAGVTLECFDAWTNNGDNMGVGSSVEVCGTAPFTRDRLVRWGDWTITLRLDQSDTQFIDVTTGRGLPTVWYEFTGIDTATIRASAKPNAKDIAGKPVKFPYKGDAVVIEQGKRSWLIAAGPGTTFAAHDDLLTVTFGADKYLSVSALPDAASAKLFYDHAYAIPRDSKISYTLECSTWNILTTWALETAALRGDNHDVMQGWLLHHLRRTKTDFKPLATSYLTPRGPLKIAAGHEFKISYAAPNVLFDLPLQPDTPGYDPAVMAKYLDDFAAKSSAKPDDYKDNTYWGGKKVERYAQAMLIAQRVGHASFKTNQTQLRNALEDWLTWTPGEKGIFFTRYPGTGALVGFPPAYGSENFTDHHFHYGYLTTAGALLALTDPQFGKDYGGMLKLVAKQYANWDRADVDFPFFRTLDIWAGHSYAAGTSSPAGNNQESTSEAINSWLGVILLGQVLGDDDMTAAGMFGYTMESEATMDYWFNESGEAWGKSFDKPNVGVLQDFGNVYATFFGAEPDWIYGIQLIPSTPALDFLARDPKKAQATFDSVLRFNAAKNRGGKLSDVGGEWGDLMLVQQARINPEKAAGEMADLLKANYKPLQEESIAGITYYQVAAYRGLGVRDFTCHTDAVLSGVYTDAKTKARTAVVYNPTEKPMTVMVYEGDKLIGTVTVEPMKLTATALK